jgi:hypothetical protein
MRILQLTILALLGMVGSVAPAAAASYTFTTIAVLPFPETSPTSINDSGQITGFFLDFFGDVYPYSGGFLYSGGNIATFGAAGGAPVSLPKASIIAGRSSARLPLPGSPRLAFSTAPASSRRSMCPARPVPIPRASTTAGRSPAIIRIARALTVFSTAPA